MTFTTRTTCRLCSGPLRTILELEPTPPANALIASLSDLDADVNGDTPYATWESRRCCPLSLAQCLQCSHVQLPVVVDPALLFSDYAYMSATSPVFREHLSTLARKLSANLFPSDLVVEIGSNDGTLLRHFVPPIRSLGIDPARNLAEKATRDGVLTYPGFFEEAVARSVRRSVGRARLIVALNVLAHADDLDGIAHACAELLADDGEIVFEVAYLPDMLRDGTFDLLYHEHASYHHLAPLIPFYERHGLYLYDAEHVDSQGGSIRCFVSKRSRAQTDRLRELLGRERELVTDDAFDRFKARIETAKSELTELLAGIKRKGGTIAGFGCPAKATTLLHHFGIGRETLDYLVEENALKIGKFSPGKHIPIVSPEHFREHPSDACVILAWNFQADIRRRFDWYQGKWILPLPEVRIA
jgi:hypothetical protein